MESAFSGLLFGLLGAIVLIYLLIVVNFQSWLDPFVIITALPAALAGIVWMLFATQHHLVGARADRRDHVHGRGHRQQRAGDQLRRASASSRLGDPSAAALDAGFARFRPVLMTALAMIIGMLPMALGLGEGGEQNAPLGPRGDRRPAVRDGGHADLRARGVQPDTRQRWPSRRRHPAARRAPCRLTRIRRSFDAEADAPWSLVGLVLLVVAIVMVAIGVTSRRSQAARLDERARAQAVRSVTVISPKPVGESAALDLPARIEAWSRAPIYARVSGYLKSWSADIGTRVKAGQLLAEIETPELDQQLLQAQAELATAKANHVVGRHHCQALAGAARRRHRSRDKARRKGPAIWPRNSLRRGRCKPTSSAIQTLKRFTRIVAPFDGVVTARNTDVGALISVGGAPGTRTVRGLRHPQAARLCHFPPDLVGAVRARRDGAADRARNGRARPTWPPFNRWRKRSAALRADAGPARGRQCGRRTVARRVRQRRLRPATQRRNAQHPTRAR